ncbi:MAG: hypothetical protein HUK02_00445 [Bacteroidaceae bacterium]|nr:hypothetical protein [Bacteroidaceae bacterium]
MKKVFKKMAVCLAMVCGGVMTTSCEGDVLSNILGVLDQYIGNLNGVPGASYQSTLSTQLMVNGTSGYSWEGDKLSYSGSTCVVQEQKPTLMSGTTESTYTLTIPSHTLGTEAKKVTTTNIVLTNLAMVNGQLEITDNSTIDGAITINDNTTPIGASNAFLGSSDDTSYYVKYDLATPSLSFHIQVYFSDDYVIDLQFLNGKYVTTAE